MGQLADEAKMRKLRLNLEKAATEQYGRRQEVCPPAQTDKRRGCQMHTNRDEVNKQENFDQKIMWFPPHYLHLRKELYEQWQDTLWPLVAWRMAFMAEEFCEYMNAATGLALAPDSEAVDWTCERYLKKLREMRGVK